jgi:hypothetical protein
LDATDNIKKLSSRNQKILKLQFRQLAFIIIGLFLFLTVFYTYGETLNAKADEFGSFKYSKARDLFYNEDVLKTSDNNTAKDVLKTKSNLSLTINTDRYSYYDGENFKVFGNVFDNNIHPINTILSLKYIYNANSTLQDVEIPAINGSYTSSLFIPKNGHYKIAISDKDNNISKYITFEAKSKIFSYTFILFYIAGILIIAYGIITYLSELKRSTPNRNLQLIFDSLRFFILSTFSLLPLLGFFIFDIEIGENSPLSLVHKYTQNQNNTLSDTKINSEWVINFGGSSSDEYSRGIQVPFYVVAFGWLGGLLRYLYRVAKKIDILRKNNEQLETALYQYKQSNDNDTSINALPLFLYSSFEELAEILLSPLLAIAVWLLLSIGTTMEIFTASVISFTVGLITKEVVESLISFVGNFLRRS